MRKSGYLFFLLGFVLLAQCVCANSSFVLRSNVTVSVACDKNEEAVVFTALDLLKKDLKTVLSDSMQIGERKTTDIIVGTLGKSNLLDIQSVDFSVLNNKKEAFLLQVLNNGKLLIVGSDKHGTAYGVLELSRLLGVSPWEWWADATPSKKKNLQLPKHYKTIQSPSVAYRGIFINDEDWGMMPWSSKTFEPSNVDGEIGPKTHAKIFELLLRLRANTFWPAMHGCSVPFFMTKGNKEMARKYGIYIGTSHCEPMLCNANGEWKYRGVGEYDFVHNKQNVLSFWKDRVVDVADQDNIYTLGMRGVHDGRMQGAKTVAEQKKALTDVISSQRELLRKYVDSDITKVPQVFIPYKEVLDAYHAGLSVPDDVTLMWCDDNYGYIRHFPDEKESDRSGGNGIYYHVSYWGRPHDYLWLSTTSPALISQQMHLAYKKGVRKMWILNVGDLKPAEYQIELFMDLAWNIRSVGDNSVDNHLAGFLQREFGDEIGSKLISIMNTYYHLAWIRRPEFMGNTRTEERNNPASKIIKDLPWGKAQIRERLLEYQKISDRVEVLSKNIPEEKQAAFFQLVKYPVQAAAQMNKKLLVAQLARHGEADWGESDAAFDSIASLTKIYNAGKWNRMMDCQPRHLPVFEKLKHDTATTDFKKERTPIQLFNAANYTKVKSTWIQSLGYAGRVVAVEKGSSLEFSFANITFDSLEVEVNLVPTHSVDGDKLRFSLSLDGGSEVIVDYETKGRSEEWKQNVLRNRSVRRCFFKIDATKRKHVLTFRAIDSGVVLDQLVLYKKEKKYQ